MRGGGTTKSWAGEAARWLAGEHLPVAPDPAYDFLHREPISLPPHVLHGIGARAIAAGVPLHRQLLVEAVLTPETYVTALADDLGLPVLDTPVWLGFVPAGQPARPRSDMVTGEIGGRQAVVLDGTAMRPRMLAGLARRMLQQGRLVAMTTPVGIRRCILENSSNRIMRQAVSGLARIDPGASARAGSWLWQSMGLAGIVGLSMGLIAMGDLGAQSLWAALATVPFLAYATLRGIALGLHRPRRRTPALGVHAGDRELPVFTLLVPLYKEAGMVHGLVDALRALDYPAAKLDIKIVLEASDPETIAAVDRLGLGPPYDIIVVPDHRPRTKPKALNFAMAFATGDYVCVYDAEDRPEVCNCAKLRPCLPLMETVLVVCRAGSPSTMGGPAG